jgi:hypothetical protein
MHDYALVLNAGSSSLKFGVCWKPEAEDWRLESGGQIGRYRKFTTTFRNRRRGSNPHRSKALRHGLEKNCCKLYRLAPEQKDARNGHNAIDSRIEVPM